MSYSEEFLIYLVFDLTVLVLALSVYLLMPWIFNKISNMQTQANSAVGLYH